MRRHAGIGAIAIALFAATAAHSGEPDDSKPSRSHFLHRIEPCGGWNPGGGLFHWWDARCLPSACGPDDYCRKPFPNLCRYRVAPAAILPGHPHTPAPTPGTNVVK